MSGSWVPALTSSRRWRSVWHAPAARTCTRTSSGPGCGFGTWTSFTAPVGSNRIARTCGPSETGRKTVCPQTQSQNGRAAPKGLPLPQNLHVTTAQCRGARGFLGGEQWNLESHPAEAVRLMGHLRRLLLSGPCHPGPRAADARGLPRVDRGSVCRDLPRFHGPFLRLRLPGSQGETLDLRPDGGCEHCVPRCSRFVPRAESRESGGWRVLAGHLVDPRPRSCCDLLDSLNCPREGRTAPETISCDAKFIGRIVDDRCDRIRCGGSRGRGDRCRGDPSQHRRCTRGRHNRP